LLGLLGGSVPFVLFFEGLARVTSGNAAFVQKTLFLWVALLAVLALRERLGIGQVLALGLLTVATLVLGGPGTLEMGAGAGMVLVATLLWSVEVIVAKRLLTSVGSSLAAAARMGVGAVVLLGYVSTQGGLGEIVDLAPAQWGWVGATGVLLLGYVITWYAALQRAPATTVTSVLTLGAPITAVLAVAAGRPAFGFEQFVGHLLLVAAAGILIMISARTDLLPRRQTPDLPIGLK
jgi:drug/metabolite transporter (DMT)-like permease